MEVRIALCQMPGSGDVNGNLEEVGRITGEISADIYLFPELFLTGYGCRSFDGSVLAKAEQSLKELCCEKGIAVAMGMPVVRGGETFNSLVFFSPEGRTEYDKLYLANFEPYNEEVFTPGRGPSMVEWKGMRFGLLICYDAMFPEIHRYYATHGADAVLMASASAEQSEYAMSTVLPARSFENTVYTLFCNNTGTGPAGRYFGGSCAYSPLGKALAKAGTGEEVVTVTLSSSEIESARKIRTHLADLRSDIVWD